MNKTSAVILILLAMLCASPGQAEQTTGPAVSTSSVCGGAGTSVLGEGPVLLSQIVTCTVDCLNGTTRSCSASYCTAVERNCSTSQPGYVTCPGAIYICPACGCTTGTLRQEPAGCCKYGVQARLDNYVCNASGQWEFDSYTCYGSCDVFPE